MIHAGFPEVRVYKISTVVDKWLLRKLKRLFTDRSLFFIFPCNLLEKKRRNNLMIKGRIYQKKLVYQKLTFL
jgi:hypothetical protein